MSMNNLCTQQQPSLLKDLFHLSPCGSSYGLGSSGTGSFFSHGHGVAKQEVTGGGLSNDRSFFSGDMINSAGIKKREGKDIKHHASEKQRRVHFSDINLLEFSSPGKDISASSTSSSTKSNLANKVQEWSASYFARKSKEERTSSTLNVSSGNKNIQVPSSSETKDKRVIRTTIGEELGIRSKGVRRSSRNCKRRSSQSNQRKPLRERASEMQTNIVQRTAPAPPLSSPPKLSLPSPPTPLILQTSSQDEEIESVPLPASPTQTVDDEKDTIKENDITVPAEQTDKRYIWAYKYRPNALKDFYAIEILH
ncbi:hypothetical protein K7X08_008295 [Anisodus acutangulus]|uniref:Uncharacterized protein n=1 Tax=Anisodus acutangulus TaxID=402998 RepID=A0A9Q1MVX1_9SOLA|nr:hypothetical protein K7X08_008295 [Anisodus acutangulus]